MYSSLSIIDRRLRKLLAVRQLGLVQTLYFSCSKPNWITERHWRDIWFRRRIVCRAKLSSTKVGQTLYCLARENSRHLATLPLVSPSNDVWETSAEIPYWKRFTSQKWGVFLIGWIKFLTRHDQPEPLPRSGYWRVISMEFLRSFLRRHFGGKPVLALRNVGCFLRLWTVKLNKTWDAVDYL